jgi:hypothetical protein
MRVRLLPVCLLSAGLLIAAAFYPALAKPPQLPVQEKIDCEEECQEAPVVQDHQAAPTCPSCAAKSGGKSKLITKVYPVADLVIPICQNSHIGLPADVNECCQEAKPIPAPVKQATIATAIVKDATKECTSCCPACASAGCCPKSTATSTPAATSQAKKVTEENHLIQLIEQTIQPKTWDAKGGAGIIDYYPITMSLAISQTAAAHEEIAELLASLRRELDTQVSVEVRFISVSEEFMGRLGMNWSAGDKECQEKKETCQAKGSCANVSSLCCEDLQIVKFLNNVEVQRMMEVLQADAKTNVTQAPKVTMLNGQESCIQVCDEHCYVTGMTVKHVEGKVVFIPQNETCKTGTNVTLQPVVSADHRFVRVKVNAQLTSLDGPEVSQFPVTSYIRQMEGEKKEMVVPVVQFIQDPKFVRLSVDKTLTLPEGGTAFVIVGKRPYQPSKEKEFGPPVLKKLPCFKQFRAGGQGAETANEVVLMMVTPRIIVSEQQEIATSKCLVPCSNDAVAKDEIHLTDSAMPLADHEEQEIAPSPKQPCSQATPTPVHTATWKAAKLVKQYRRACAEGDSAKATELAIKALAIDPMCFGKK